MSARLLGLFAGRFAFLITFWIVLPMAIYIGCSMSSELSSPLRLPTP